MLLGFTAIFYLFPLLGLFAAASPTTHWINDPVPLTLHHRAQPFFPASPASCPICEKDYPSIQSCAQAAPVLSNFTMIIFNPGAFIDVIKCACVETFQAVFPQCVDCFIQTNQSEVLNAPNLPAVVDGMRKICALESTLLGNVSATNGEVTPTPTPTPTSIPTSGAVSVGGSIFWGSAFAFTLIAIAFR